MNAKMATSVGTAHCDVRLSVRTAQRAVPAGFSGKMGFKKY
jgi:hypothetical protein